MKRVPISEKLLLKEATEAALKLKLAFRGLSIGALLKLIRLQLGMSQKALAKRAKVPQSTVSRLEQSQKGMSLSTLNKVAKALFCELIIVPILQEPIEALRQKQAKKVAAKRAAYLRGTMHLEEQEPDFRFMEEMAHEEENELLHKPKIGFWDE